MTPEAATRVTGSVYDFRPIVFADPASWDATIERFDSRSLFHRSTWLDYLAGSRRVDIRRWAIRDDEKTVGYLCAGVLRMGPFRILGSPLKSWGTNVMGPLVDAGIDQRRLVGALDALARRERLSTIELESPVLSGDVLRDAGFESVTDWTYLVKLWPDESLMWQSLESVCRNRIRKAERSGLTVEDTDDPRAVDEYYDLYLRMMRRKGRRATFDLRTVHLLFDNLKRADNLFALRVRDAADRVVAVGLFPHDDQIVYFWSGASDVAAHALCPNDLLHWTAMRLAAHRGLNSYNMSGYGRFKRKFGGILTTVTRWHKCYSHAARLGRRAYELWFRKLGSRFCARPSGTGLPRKGTPNDDVSTDGSWSGPWPLPSSPSRIVRPSDLWRAPLHDFPIRDAIIDQYMP